MKKLASVDIEKVNNIKEFVEYAVTSNRFDQAVNEVFTMPDIEISKKKLGDLIKWTLSDIVKEELDTLASNNLEPKDIGKAVGAKVVRMYTTKYGI